MTYALGSQQQALLAIALEKADSAALDIGYTEGAYARAYELLFAMISNVGTSSVAVTESDLSGLDAEDLDNFYDAWLASGLDAEDTSEWTKIDGDIDDGAWVFLRGVAGVNWGFENPVGHPDGETDYSKFIRKYTAVQYATREGATPSDAQVQDVSDAIAFNILDDILGADGNITSLANIAKYDAAGAATALLGAHVAGWAGAPLLIAAGHDDSYKKYILHDSSAIVDGVGGDGDLTNTYDVLAMMVALKASAAEIGLVPSLSLISEVITQVAWTVSGASALIATTIASTDSYLDNAYGYNVGTVGAASFATITLGTGGNDSGGSAIMGAANGGFVHAGAGDDVIIATYGDLIDGGLGLDLLVYVLSTPVVVAFAELDTHGGYEYCIVVEDAMSEPINIAYGIEGLSLANYDDVVKFTDEDLGVTLYIDAGGQDTVGDTADFSALTTAIVVDGGIMGTAIGLEEFENFIGGSAGDRFVDEQGVENVYDGGDGLDVIDYSDWLVEEGLVIDFNDFSADGDGNTLTSIEGAVGTVDDDLFIDKQGVANVIEGHDGYDVLDYSERTAGISVDIFAFWNEVAVQSDSDGNIIWDIDAIIGTGHADWFVDNLSDSVDYDGGDGFDVFDAIWGGVSAIDLTEGVSYGMFVDGFSSIEGWIHTDGVAFLVNELSLPTWFELPQPIVDIVEYDVGSGPGNVIAYHNEGAGTFEFLGEFTAQARPDGPDPEPYQAWVLTIVDDISGDVILQRELAAPPPVYDFTFWGRGTTGNDTMFGDWGGTEERSDTMEGGLGDDTMSGGGGNDTMDGGAGNDDLNGGIGDDTLYAGNGDDTVDGGAGDDTLIAGSGAGNDSYDGGADIDTIVYSSTTAGVTVDLSAGSNHATGTEIDTDQIVNVENVIGGSGNDTITGDGANNVIEGAGGNDTLTGGSGTDTASYAGASAGVTVSLATGSAQNTGGAGTDTLSGFENLAGSTHSDTLTGSSAANTLSGDDGDDILAGGAGSDTLDGGDGADTADYRTAASAVTVNLSTGSTSNDGDSSSDTLISIERVIGSAGADSITGDSGDNVIEGAGGNDTLVGGLGTDTLSYAHASSAVTVNLATTSAQNTVGAGTDTVSGFENLTGSAYNDTLTGDTGGNVIDGGGGNDLIKGSTGNDTLNGGDGTDTVTFAGASAVTVSLAAGTATGDGTDTLANFENVTGSSNGDTITGDAGANTLDGGNGNDTLVGGAGNDTLIGGAGTDTVDYSAAVSGVTVDLSTGTATDGSGGTDTLSGFEHIIGSAYSDTLTGSTLVNTINGGAGDDTIYGLGNSDNLSGGDGNDTIHGDAGNDDLRGNDGDDIIYGWGSADNIYGDDGNDLIHAGDGNDTNVQGGDGNDVIYGDAGNDTIRGNSQNDILYGGDGADTLEGQTDSDILYGGDGLDTLSGLGSGGGTDGYNVFVFEAASAFNNTDVITDFSTGATYYDMIDITSLMSSYTAGVDDIDDFIYIHVSGSDSYLAVDANGGGDAFVDVAKLQGVTGLATVESLVASRRILIADENVIFGSTATETINGTSGVDMIFGITGNDTIYAGAGSDFIKTEVGNQTIYGEGGNDVIESGNNNDYLDGGDGDDTFTSGYGDDTVIGGAGTDVLLWGAVSDYVIIYRENANYLTVRDTWWNPDDVDYIYNDVETIQFNDVTLDLTAMTFTLNGLGWGTARSVSGTSSAETLYGFNAVDIIDGNNGNDTIYGYYGDDVLAGGNGTDTLYGGEGDDVLKGGASSDTLDGGNGTDTADYTDAASGVTVSLSSGTQSGGSVGNDTLTAIENVLGSAYGDTITGDGGANVLTGGAGGDTLNGGSGADTLYGGDGTDTLYGNGGADTFVFEAATAFNNVDTVSDFSTGDTDKIDIADILDGVYDYGVDSILDFVKIENSGSDSVLKIDADGGGDSFVTIATLLGITGLTDEAGLESAGTLITH